MCVCSIPLCGCLSNTQDCWLGITMGSVLSFSHSLTRKTISLPCFFKPYWSKLPFSSYLCWKYCSLLIDKTRNLFWDKIWILCDLVTCFLVVVKFPLFLGVLIHQIGFGKLIQHFLPQEEGPHWLKVTCPWQIHTNVKGRSDHQGQAAIMKPHRMVTAVSYALLLTTKRNEVRMEVWVRATGAPFWKHWFKTICPNQPSVTWSSPMKENTCHDLRFPLSKLLFIHFKLWYLHIPVSHPKTHF